MLEIRSGTHQIPVMITPENWCIADSTPMMAMLDGRLREPRFYPRGVVGALAAVLEEYFDEWSARWCIHTRWGTTEETAQHAATSMVSARNLPPKLAKKMAQNVILWGRKASKALGVSSDVQKRECESEIIRIFESFNNHLKDGYGPFVFGNARMLQRYHQKSASRTIKTRRQSAQGSSPLPMRWCSPSWKTWRSRSWLTCR